MKKILIVDDDEDVLFIVKYVLDLQGFSVVTHPTGTHVQDIVRRYRPDIILIDIFLYGTLGTEICRKLKKLYDIPIILFSSHVGKGEAFASCNADGFIKKPFDIKDLPGKIETELKKYKLAKRHHHYL